MAALAFLTNGVVPAATGTGLADNMDGNLKNPYSHQASVQVSQELGGIAVSASYLYVGAREVPIHGSNLNAVQTGTTASGKPSYAGGRRDPALGDFFVTSNLGFSTYHGGTLEVEKRFDGKIGFHASYTYSHSRSRSDSVANLADLWQSPDGEAEDAFSRQHVPHRFTLSFMSQVPKDVAVLHDFKFAALLSTESGRRLHAVRGERRQRRRQPELRPHGARGTQHHRGSVGYDSVDLRVAREFPLGKRVRGELSVDAFNLLQPGERQGPEHELRERQPERDAQPAARLPHAASPLQSLPDADRASGEVLNRPTGAGAGVTDRSRSSGYRRPRPGTQPDYLHPPYKSSVKRAPAHALVPLAHSRSETTGPSFPPDCAEGGASDLTHDRKGEALGERIVVTGRVLDEDGRPLRKSLVEIWQANAAGRYLHEADQHDAPLDPHFTGSARLLTDDEGRYHLLTIKPGAYPWGNHANAWRPAHIHFSVFGPAFATRLVTQMYFPGDPLLPHDPIFNCTADERARQRLVSAFDWETTTPGYALGYRFDIVLAGREATPLEAGPALEATTSQTVGPFYSIGMGWMKRDELAPASVAGERVAVEGRVLDGDGNPVPDAILELWQAALEGYGRVGTDEEGRFRFTTARIPAASDAPHIAVSVFARGLMKRLVTRMYFPDEPQNASDPVLSLVEPSRRGTLVAAKRPDGTLHWDVVLQGIGETAFFDC